MLEAHAHFTANFINLLQIVGKLDPVDDDLPLLMLFQAVDATDHR